MECIDLCESSSSDEGDHPSSNKNKNDTHKPLSSSTGVRPAARPHAAAAAAATIIDLCQDDDDDDENDTTTSDEEGEDQKQEDDDCCIVGGGKPSSEEEHLQRQRRRRRNRRKQERLKHNQAAENAIVIHPVDDEEGTSWTTNPSTKATTVQDPDTLYRQALGPIRMAFCHEFVSPRHYFPVSTAASASSNRRRLRLQRELIEYQLNLPISATSSIFCRVLESRSDAIRVLMTGPTDTPYAHGCFCFDVQPTADYPAVPPRVQFLTTGQGQVRFHPNLYNSGKVCLSLLGTWSGPGWRPHQSTLLQVLVSIQGLILGATEPYFCEPGWEGHRGTLHGQQASQRYNSQIRKYTLQHAILQPLQCLRYHQQPPAPPEQAQRQVTFTLTATPVPTTTATTVAATATASPPSSTTTTTTTRTTRRMAWSQRKPPPKRVKRVARMSTVIPPTFTTTTSTTTMTPASACHNPDLFAEFRQVLYLHFCQVRPSVHQQVQSWMQHDASIIPLAQHVLHVLDQVVDGPVPRMTTTTTTNTTAAAAVVSGSHH